MTWQPVYTKTEKRELRYPLLRHEYVIFEEFEQKKKIKIFMMKRVIFEKRKFLFNRKIRKERWKEQWVSFTPEEIDEAKVYELSKKAEAERKFQEEDEFVFV